MDFLFEQYVYRIKSRLHGTRGREFIPQWLMHHTRDPKDTDKPWSFDGHEFQPTILKDSSNEISIKKCSQVGVSEIIARISLALSAMRQGIQLIYTLPTSTFSTKFCKTRFDPVIAASPTLSSMLNSDVDSSQLKQIGLSFIHIVGTFSSSAPISIPASVLINDEVDFSDQDVLTTFTSRLGHEADGGLQIDFSTPTVGGFGISARYEHSSQGRYAIFCLHCGSWQIPNFFDDVVVPGFNDPLIKLEKTDLSSPRIRITESKLLCPACRGEITQNNLSDPSLREWIHAYPEREHRGYHVVPFDVPLINTIPKTVGSLANYRRKASWVNFEVGEYYQDAESTVLIDVVRRNTVLQAATLEEGSLGPCVMGVDIGKYTHILVGRVRGELLQVIYLEQLNVNTLTDGLISPHLLKLIAWFRVVRSVIDALPDFTTALSVVRKLPEEMAYGCYYKRENSRMVMSNIQKDDLRGSVQVSRTGTFDETVRRVNKGLILFPKHPLMPDVESHLDQIKRVMIEDASGAPVGRWESTGPDHWAHALNYAVIASELLDDRFRRNSGRVLPSIHGVRMKQPEEVSWGG